MVGGDHRLAHGPGGITAFHRQIAQGDVRRLDRTRPQRAHCIGDGFQILRHGELGGLAQADHQDARRNDSGDILQQHGLSGFSTDVAALG
jgi:hypothetical protein